jgi:tetratricopeptide (TPR) repeat protein
MCGARLVFPLAVSLTLTLPVLPGQDAAYPFLETAYAALEAKEYDAAIAAFRQAIAAAPARASVRKDLAYTLLKVGENEAARDEFGEAMKLDPDDHHVALEHAFLCFETRQEGAARRIFDRVRREGVGEARQTAEQAFQNIDRPLAEGIERWKKVVEMDPNNFSAHWELAKLAEHRDALELALQHYQYAWKLRPDRRRLLLNMGRVWKGLGREEEAATALLAASRGAEPRVAEEARALLPSRYPYVYEFERSLALDPDNTGLRRELAYLHLEMGRMEEAEEQFRLIVAQAPDDLLSLAQLGFLHLGRKDYEGARPLLERVLASSDNELTDRVRKALNLPQTMRRAPETPPTKVSVEAKVLAEKSFEAGYLKDAMKYFTIAHLNDPSDFQVMLNLGRTHNVLRQDDQAILWFDLARRSPDPAIAREAERSYNNLRPAFARFRTTMWMMPLYSTRWRDLFAYAQVKTEVNLGKIPLRLYVSVRFAGDARQTAGSVVPQYLSESSFIIGVGIRTVVWKGIFAWAEAGSDVSYLDRRDRPGRMAPDYRGGVSVGRGLGNFLGGEAPGFFFDTFSDGVFMSRFSNTFLGSSRNRFGYTLPAADGLGGFQTQLYWNGNATVDWKRQAWANFLETGPGLRFRWKWMPPSLFLTADALRGRYLIENYPRGRNYYDLRGGLWYAFSH